MSKQFKPIKIGVDTANEKAYTINVDNKKNRFNALFAYIAGFIRVEDKQRFKSDIYGTFISEFSDLTRPSFPTLTISKIAELHNLQLHKLEALINSFNDIQIDWNFEKNEPIKEPCFDILTTCEEQNNRYQKTKSLCEAIEAMKEDKHFYPADIVRGANGTLAFDFETNQIIPSIGYILNTPVRSY
jgi:hypothetical protein